MKDDIRQFSVSEIHSLLFELNHHRCFSAPTGSFEFDEAYDMALLYAMHSICMKFKVFNDKNNEK